MYKLINKLFCFILFLPLIGMSQQQFFQKTYEFSQSTTARSIKPTYDNGFIICGATHEGSGNGNDLDFLLIKTDSMGTKKWYKHFGDIRNDKAYSVVETADSGFAICGQTQCEGGYKDLYIVRTDKDGNKLWDTKVGGEYNEYGMNIQNTTDGGFIVVGFYQKELASELIDSLEEGEENEFNSGHDFGNSDIFLVKFDPNGKEQWEKKFGGDQSENGRGVKQTPDGGYIVAGNTESYGAGMNDIFLVRTDSLGKTIWAKTFGLQYADKAYSVDLTNDGNYIISGYTSTDGNKNGCLLKISPDGNLIWETIVSEAGSMNNFRSVRQNPDGSFIMGGNSQDQGSGIYDAIFVKVSEKGKELWRKKYGGLKEERCYNVNYAHDGNYVLVGSSTSFSTDTAKDVYFVKTLNCSAVSDPYLQLLAPFGLFDCDSTVLKAQGGLGNYEWNTKDSSNYIIIKRSGDYYVSTSRDECAFYSDTVYVSIVNPVVKPLIDSTLIAGCFGNYYRLSFTRDERDFDDLLWSNNEHGDTIKTGRAGEYVLSAISNECGTFTDTIQIPAIDESKPLHFTYQILSSDSIRLVWDAVDDVDFYQIEYNIIGDEPTKVAVTDTAKLMHSLRCCATYAFTIKTKCNGDWDEIMAPTLYFTTPDCPDFECNYNHEKLFEFYPNPAHTLLHISLISPSANDVYFYITDLTGKMVYNLQEKSYESKSIDISHIDKGLYMIWGVSNDIVQNYKLIIN